MSPVDRAGWVTKMKLVSIHMVTFSRLSERMLLIPGTGKRERESGTKCTAATLLRIQNGGQNKRKGSKRNNLGQGEFPPAVPSDGQYVLVRAESD